MDIYGTRYLNRVVDSLVRSPAFILNSFFRQVETSEAEEVLFDVEIDGTKRRLAPFVHPMVEGKVVESLGYETKSFRPAYIKDKRVHDASRPFRREIGEQIGTGQELSPMQRRELAIRRDLRDQVDMITRRMETMAVEALRTGKETVTMLMPNDVEKTVVVDFGRHTDLTITLTGGERWGQAGVKPRDDLTEWGFDVLQKSGSSIRNIVMDPDAWKLYEDSLGEKELNFSKVQAGEIRIDLVPDHVNYMGTDGRYDYWVYADWYINPATGSEVALLPSGTVLGCGDIMGVRHFGAIKDEAAGFQSREYFSKSWVIEDPSTRNLLTQSAPLIVPYRPNACFCANVLG